MADERDESRQPDALVHTRPSFGGMWRFLRGRPGRPTPPKRDPSKVLVTFQPRYRVVIWEGPSEDHITGKCAPLVCSNPDAWGEHSETRPDGFDWEGTHFHSLHDALENQAFQQWYEREGEDVLAQDAIVLRDPQYADGKKPPLPAFNFFIHEHIEEMTAKEIMDYRRNGTVPKHLRRRGRNKPKAEEAGEGDML